MALALCIDRVGYGVWVLSAVQFIRFNATQGLSRLYGVHPWHWYLSEGLSAMVGSMWPYLLIGAAHSKSRLVLLASSGVVLVFSQSPHKEHRFVLPLLPLLLVYAGHGARLAMTDQATSALDSGLGLVQQCNVASIEP